MEEESDNSVSRDVGGDGALFFGCGDAGFFLATGLGVGDRAADFSLVRTRDRERDFRGCTRAACLDFDFRGVLERGL